MYNEFYNPQTSKRRNGLYIGSNGFPTRAITATRGSTISIDSIASSDGIPSGIFWRGETEEEWKTPIIGQRRSGMKFIKRYPISVSWWIGLLSLGLILQLVVK